MIIDTYPTENSTGYSLLSTARDILGKTSQRLADMDQGLSTYFWDYEDDSLRRLAYAASNALDTALDFFTGYRPTCLVYAHESEPLSWQHAYWKDVERDAHINSTRAGNGQLILNEVLGIAEQLLEQGIDALLDEPGAVWSSPALMQCQDTLIKALAVQAMSCADVALAQIDAGDYARAGVCLTTAHHSLFLAYRESASLVAMH